MNLPYTVTASDLLDLLLNVDPTCPVLTWNC